MRVSASVTEDVYDFLDQPGRNKSATIVEAVRLYMKAKGGNDAVLELRERQIQSRLNAVESEASSLRDELDQIREEKESARQRVKAQERDALEEAMEHVKLVEFNSAPEPQPKDAENWERIAENYDVEMDDLLAAKREEYDA